MSASARQWPTFLVAFVVCAVLRIIPGRPPNVEPLLASIMPFGKVWGWAAGCIFGVLSIVLFDVLTQALGIWTVVTAVCYGILGAGSGAFLRRFPGMWGVLLYGIIGTLFYDAITGLTLGPLLWGQPFRDALVGQIPFTINHVLGTMVLSLTLTPLLEHWILRNPRLVWTPVLGSHAKP